MTGDKTQIAHVLTHHFGCLLGNVFMGSTMKTITTQAVFDVHFVRQAIQICYSGHGLMEGRIENSYLRCIIHQAHTGLDAVQVRRIMQRGNLGAGFDAVKHVVADQDRVCKTLAAMHDTMTNSVDFVHAVNNAVFFIGQGVQRHLDTDGMIRDLGADIYGIFAGRGMF